MLKLKLFVTSALLISSTVYANKLELFCETGEPSGAGPIAYIDLLQNGPAMAVSIQLNINSVDPQFRRPNTSINRSFIVPISKTLKWKFLFSNAYQVQLAKNPHDKKLWVAKIDSRNNKFEPIYLACQP